MGWESTRDAEETLLDTRHSAGITASDPAGVRAALWQLLEAHGNAKVCCIAAQAQELSNGNDAKSTTLISDLKHIIRHQFKLQAASTKSMPDRCTPKPNRPLEFAEASGLYACT